LAVQNEVYGGGGKERITEITEERREHREFGWEVRVGSAMVSRA
jgi:hypothetical protein